ncbi:MAG: alpha/beta hydrolase [Verrucomicrobiales bacterium]|nr:alpha/beta hydrolase [Verrucomicrobiales bacterium]
MKYLIALACLLFFSFSAEAQKNYAPVFDGAEEHVYKTASEVELKMWGFLPEDWAADDSRPAILFFFGGGWTGGNPGQFEPHARYLADRGMVAFVVDYRVASRHGTLAKDCVDDARDAMRYLRGNSGKLGIDPDRIAAGGGSAGGHIAACLGVIAADPESKPGALALFNPACVLAPFDGKQPWTEDRSAELKERMGVDPEALSPVHHVTAEAPPCIIFHGTADDKVPLATAAQFAVEMKRAGVKCILHEYPGEPHGFFNAGRKPAEGNEPALPQTLKQLDDFLVELGWLE